MAITLNQIKKEIVNLIRNENIITTTIRGVTTKQDTGTFTNILNYTLATTPLLTKNIRSVIVGSNTLKWGRDYTLDFETGVITFTSAQTGVYTISYDTGSTDRIFPDYPQANLKLNQFPRIAVDIIGSTSNEVGIGASITQSTYNITIICYSKSQEEIEEMVTKVKKLIMDNKKNLHYSAFITPTAQGPILISEFGERKMFQRNQDCQVRFSFDGT
jgi:hypothetical protein